MSSNDIQIETILEGNIESMDFGFPDLNQLYKELRPDTKKKIHNLSDKKKQINALKKIQTKKAARLEKPSSESKIAIIIPFRDNEKEKKRTKQLNNLVEYFKTYLKDDQYKIYVIEQSEDNRKFNRGQLLNIGFEYASKDGCNNFIFHDVDLLPSEELKEYYEKAPKDKPVHIAAVWDRYGSNPKYFGGIVAFNKEMFSNINGYPNNFWGWGGEDDELYKRTKKSYDILKVKKGSIRDLEDLTLEKKLDYLKENDLKFMQKNEALAEHEATWKKNGLNTLNYKEMEIDSCGLKCEKITVDLNNVGNVIISEEKEENLLEAPKDILQEEEEEHAVPAPKTHHKPPQERFSDLIKLYYSKNPFVKGIINHELEVKFGTKGIKGIKQLNRNDYDNVIKKLKSSQFNINGDSSGLYSLRVNCEFLDNATGKFKMSDVRSEINGIDKIQWYCQTNDIKELYKGYSPSVNFIHKKPVYVNKDKVFPVDFDDFNFRVSYQTEEVVKTGVKNFIINSWKKSKKEFRFMNRVSFSHPEYPFIIDLSIVKYGNRHPDKFGNENKGQIKRVYTLDESNIFNNPEHYEMEIEVNNAKIGPGTKYDTPESILESLRKVTKIVLSGLQGTNYPISYLEQKTVIDTYMKLIWKDEYETNKHVSSKKFIGPNSITLQMLNIAKVDENSNEPNIRKDFVVTEKADGQRHLMYISNEGKIYLINTNMDVLFTGAKTNNKECFNSLLDGELISHDKKGKFINLYAAFDIYFLKKQDIRMFTFMLLDTEDDVYKSRYQLLKYFEKTIDLVSVLDTKSQEQKKEKSLKDMLSLYKNVNNNLSPIRFTTKEFFPNNNKQTIFEGCDTILKKVSEGRFEYETDGLIFTHAFYGVGSNVIGKAGPKTKITWENSFKWKPPKYNTIDFLVTTIKGKNGDDVVKSLHQDGQNNLSVVQIKEYKTIELRCGFKESKDGFINPCQDIIDDKIPEFTNRSEDKQDNDYVPMRFYPTEPYDPNAGLCNIMLSMDGSGGKKMFSEEHEVFQDNTIVEFRYDLNKEEGWRWIPLRVRYDKTSKMMRGEKEYGNAYKVCNDNWKSIHPTGRIEEDMLRTGNDIPSISISEDKYYNTPAGKFKTQSMKDFHNLYVKKRLISNISKQGDTLIDFACGKAGDLPKWISSKLSFVFGIDISPDNLENRIDGACARFLNMKKSNKNMPHALFVNGNSAYNIKDGTAMLNEKAKQITSAVFGNGTKESDKIGKGVARQYGKGVDGFNVSSCQFAMHYFFQNPDTLRGFMKNLAECTKQNGYFIGTCYDGKIVFNELKKIKTGESIKIIEDGKKILEITKHYGADTFEDNSSSIGYKIKVYQESINQGILEYLVNFDYFNRVMQAYGFEVISREEANEAGLPEGSGLFSELFINMLDEISKNKFKSKDYGQAPNMSRTDKKISFLNRYFVYKKVRTVNTEAIQLELGEYNETEALRNAVETRNAQTVAKEEVAKIKPKVRKLSKKLMLVAATEALEPQTELAQETKEKVSKKTKPAAKKTKPAAKKLLIIEDNDEDE